MRPFLQYIYYNLCFILICEFVLLNMTKLEGKSL